MNISEFVARIKLVNDDRDFKVHLNKYGEYIISDGQRKIARIKEADLTDSVLSQILENIDKEKNING